MRTSWDISICCLLLFFNDSATTEIYTLSLHDALPIFGLDPRLLILQRLELLGGGGVDLRLRSEGTRLNSSHRCISYAVFCLKKKMIRLEVWVDRPKSIPGNVSPWCSARCAIMADRLSN